MQALLNDAAGATSCIGNRVPLLLTSATAAGGGTILIESELITYTTITTGTNTLNGFSRGTNGTSDVEHARWNFNL